MTSIDWLVVGGPAEPWTALGLLAAVQPDGSANIPLFGTGIAVAGSGDPGMRGWVVSGIDSSVVDIDGVATTVGAAAPPLFAAHPLGVQSIDHVVVSTDDLVRTCGAIADATGAPLKRVREAGGGVRQGFHRIGSLVIEVVEREGQPAGPASLWGFVLIVDDLATACAQLGADVISEPREAVQPGRSIATVRSDVGLGVALALMSPDLR